MCGRFLLVPGDELTRIINDIKDRLAAEAAPAGQNAPVSAAPPAPADVFPKGEAPVLLPGPGGLRAEVKRWGYPVSWQKGVVFNTRAETALALGPNMWADSLRHRRCVVPSLGFYEPHKTETAISPKTGRPIKAQYRFNLPGSPLLFMAGIYEAGYFSIMTTAPNRWMAPVHDRMPVVLRPHECEQWLTGNYAALCQRGDVALESWAVTA